MPEDSVDNLNSSNQKQNGMASRAEHSSSPFKLENIIAAVPDYYLILSPDLRIEMATDAYLAGTYTKREEIIGKYLFAVFPDNPKVPDAQGVKNLHDSLQQVLATKKQHRMPLQHYDVPAPAGKKGEFAEKYWLPVNTPVLDEQGEVSAIIHKVEDVTELVQHTHRLRWLEQEVEQSMQKREKLIREYEIDNASLLYRFLNNYRDLVENVPDVITRWDKNGQLLFANAAFQTKTGVNNASLYGKTSREMGQPEHISGPWMEKLQKVFHSGNPAEHYHSFPTPEGFAYFYSRLVPEKNATGNVETVLDIARDITELKKAEQEIKEHKDLLQTVFDSSPNSLSVYKILYNAQREVEDFEILIFNAFTERTTRLTNEQVVGKRYTEVFPNTQETGVVDRFKEAVRTGQPVDFEQWYEGEGMHLWFRFIVVKQDDLLVVTTEDITKRKKAEQEILRLKEEVAQNATDKYLTLFHSIDQGFCIIQMIFDENGEPLGNRFLEANPVFEKQTGLQDAVGKTMKELQPAHEEYWFRIYGEIAKTGEPKRFEQRAERLAGGVWYEVFAFPFGKPEDQQVAILFNDITERKNAEQRQALFLKLSDALRPLLSPKDIQATATHTALGYFEADRCYYAELEDNAAIIRQDAIRPGLPSMVGTYDLSRYPVFTSMLNGGRPLVVRDVLTSDMMDETLKEFCRQSNILSYINAPILENGQAVGLFSIVEGTTRQWTETEVTVAQELAERTWAAVERAKAEEALREKETLLAAVLEGLPVGIGVMDINGKLLLSNKEMQSFLPTGTMPSKDNDRYTRWIAYYPDGSRIERQDFPGARALRGESVVPGLEMLYMQENGAQIWTRVAAVPISDEEGNIQGQVAVVTDINELKQSALALRESEQRFRSLVTATSDIVYKTSADWTLMYHLEGKNFLADTRNVNRSWMENYIPEPERPRITKAIVEAIQNKTIFELEHQVFDAHGNLAWTYSRAVPKLNENGEITEWFGAASNITLRKKAEEALRESEIQYRSQMEQEVNARTRELKQNRDLLEAIFNISPSGLYVFRSVRQADGQIVDFDIQLANRAAEVIDEKPITGLRMLESWPYAHQIGIFDLLVEAVERSLPVDYEQYYEKDGHPKYFRWLATKLNEDNLYVAFEDVTRRKQAERAVKENKDLLQAVFDAAVMGITVFESVRNEAGEVVDFIIRLVNPVVEKTAVSPLVGARYAELYPAVRDSGIFPAFVRVVDTGEPADFEQYYEADGFAHWFRITAVKQNDGLVSTVENITQRKQTEAEKEKSLQLLQQAEELAGLGSWEYNLDTGEFKWSEGMYRLFGLKPGTPISPQTYRDWVVAEDRPIAERIIRYLIEEPTSFEETLRIKPDGIIQSLKVKGTVVKDVAGKPAKMLGLDLNITEVKRLEEENLALRLQQQKDLLLAILEAQEEERRRISESLHNGVGQILYATQLSLQQMNFTKTPLLVDKLESTKEKTEALLKDAIKETRHVSHELVPLLLEQFGLDAALQDFCERFSHTGIQLTCQSLTQRLEKYLELAVYRISQELMNNIAKHSGATRARVEIFQEGEQLIIEAQDNGKGIEANASHRKGIGLKTMQDRVNLLGGTLDIESQPGWGTLITIILPIYLSSVNGKQEKI